MRVFVTGASGQLGSDVIQALEKNNIECCGVSSKQLDITDRTSVLEMIKSLRPDAVVHCAAYTKVDKAEDEPELCFSVNEYGTENIAVACREVSAKLLYISTDYVFDGKGTDYYEINNLKSPLNIYGLSKLKGEDIVQKYIEKYFIIRTSWAFGINGSNFIKTILRIANTNNQLKVIDDQIGSPTFTEDLADLIVCMIQTDKYGVYHATNEGICSWYELAETTLKLCEKHNEILRISSDEYIAKAKRPLNSRLSKDTLDKSGFERLPHWKDALARFLIKLTKQKEI